MAASRFDEELPVLMDGNKQVGVCAMGPIGDGEKLVWMRVWAWQQDEDSVPASDGNAGVHVPGAHQLKPEQKPPFEAPEAKWMVQTGLAKDSPDYNLDKPVLVQAIALVEKAGQSEIVQWSQAVGLREPHVHSPDEHSH
jgi:hypothetical protein